jgi:hypothetical protein
MKSLTKSYDSKINADNFLIELNIAEYLALAERALDSNEYQRRRVKSASSVYALLKKDLLEGCLIPPIVMGLPTEASAKDLNEGNICQIITNDPSDLLILDGLQRTYTIIELRDELKGKHDEDALVALLSRTMRVELYVGINRIGILYRMLTLNTGQTPMSLRQQIEMLYIDFAKIPIDGVVILKESDDDSPQRLGEYTFRSVIDGFNSYLERNELPLDRFDILENIKSLEKLSTENADANLFELLVKTYDKFIKRVDALTGSKEFTKESIDINGQVFGKDARRIFSKSQAITGFGSAIGKLKDFGQVSGFQEISEYIDSIKESNALNGIESLLKFLEIIRLNSKKIGNAQRLYFHFLFRELFNKDSDSFSDLQLAVENAFQKYQVQMG